MSATISIGGRNSPGPKSRSSPGNGPTARERARSRRKSYHPGMSKLHTFLPLVLLFLSLAFPIASFSKPEAIPGLRWFLLKFIHPWGEFGYIPIAIITALLLGLSAFFWF